MENFKIGVFAIGLDAYWPQFEGLESRLRGYFDRVVEKLKAIDPHVINVGIVDNIDGAFQAGYALTREDVDIIFIYAATYSLSATVLPVVQRARVPVVILNLSPEPAIDYARFNSLNDRRAMTAEWLAFCSPCPVPELTNVFNRVGIEHYTVTGMLDNDPECWNEISQWIEAARVANTLFFNRMACIGHYYSGMLDIYTDLTQIYRYFGGHIEHIEVEELARLRMQVPPDAVEQRLALFYSEFDVQSDCSPEELAKAAITSIALEQLVKQYRLGSIAYYYKGVGNAENEEAISTIILGNSLLTARGVPVAGEYEIKNAVAMKIMDSFGAGGSFTEFYAMDFPDDVVLLGHDGPGHIAIAEGKAKVRPLGVYHGKVGKGLSIEMSVRNGPVTLLSVIETKGGAMAFLIAEGESVPGPILEIGNTNSRYRFPIGARRFVAEWSRHGPAHHCAVGVGHIGDKIRKLGQLLGMEVIEIG